MKIVKDRAVAALLKKQASVRTQANFGLGYLVFVLIGNLAYSALADYQLSEKSAATSLRIFQICFTVAIFGAIAWLMRNYLRQARSLAAHGNLDPIPEPYQGKLQAILDDYLTRSSLPPVAVGFWLDRSNLGSVPSVVANRTESHVIVPAGFLKLMTTQPDVAAALIAHELTHIVQKDARAMLATTAAMKGATKILVPVVVAAFLLNIGSWFYLNSKLENARAHNAVIQQQADENEKKIESQGGFSMSGLDTQIRILEAEAPLERAVDGTWVSTVPSAISMIMILLLVSALKNLRHQAEEVADMTAAYLYGPKPVISYIENILPEARRGSLHPKRKERLKSVERFAALIPEEQPEVREPVPV